MTISQRALCTASGVGVFLAAIFLGALPVSAAPDWVKIKATNVPSTVDYKKIDSTGVNGIVVGSAGWIAYTKDSGKTWTGTQVGISTETFNDVSMVPGDDIAWIVSSLGRILKTTDGGITWSVQADITSVLHGVHAFGPNDVWAVGEGNTVMRKRNNGAWASRSHGLGSSWYDVVIVGSAEPSNGYIVGYGVNAGAVVKISDADHSDLAKVDFDDENPNTTAVLYGVHYKSANEVFAVGAEGTIRKWDGTSWTTITPSSVASSHHLLDIHMQAGSNQGGIIANSLPSLYQTADSGATWIYHGGSAPLGDTSKISGVWISPSDANRKFYVGDDADLAKYDAFPPSAPTNVKIGGDANLTVTSNKKPTCSWNAVEDGETLIKFYKVTFVNEVKSHIATTTATSLAPSIEFADSKQFRCIVQAVDGAMSYSEEGSSQTVKIDTTDPLIGSPVPTSAVVGTAVMVKASVSDASAFTCNLLVQDVDQGSMTIANGQASRSYTFTESKEYTVTVKCKDEVGNEGTKKSPVDVEPAGTTPPPPEEPPAPDPEPEPEPEPEPDPTDLNVSAAMSAVGVSPSSIQADGVKTATVTVIVRNASSQGLAGKSVSLASTLSGVTIIPAQATTDASGTVQFTIASSIQGSALFTATADGMVLNQKPTLNLTAPITASCSSPVVDVGSLVKLPDDGNVNTQEDSAVYYYGADCKRHAFPNSKVYFTWFSDFSGVVVVELSDLASMPLGKNVTYRPGVRMVKFTTVNNVYAVSKGGVLRWVKTEGIAISLYGSTWNKKIDDISDAFFVNYVFGTDVNNESDYNVAAEMAGASTIDETL